MSSSQLTLLAYVFVLMPGMLLGFFFARRKMFQPHHKMVMTTITIVNWVLILLLMAVSYSSFVLPALQDGQTDIITLLPTVHLITGGLAQLLATYLVLLMWTENTPLEPIILYRIKNIKTPMRMTLALWLITVMLGIGIYVTWNAPVSADVAGAPVSTEEAPDASSTEDASDPAATEAAEDTADEDVPDAASTEDAGDSADEGAADEDVPDAASTEDAGDTDESVPEPDATEDA
ncbi:MAG: hypothetical protein ACPG7F_04015 [Aggregatilineales bacterium]